MVLISQSAKEGAKGGTNQQRAWAGEGDLIVAPARRERQVVSIRLKVSQNALRFKGGAAETSFITHNALSKPMIDS